MTHYVMRQPPPDPVRDEIHGRFVQHVLDTSAAIDGRVDEALRYMFERGQVTPDTAVVTFTYDATKRAIVVGGERVWEGWFAGAGRHTWEWRERWL